MPLSFMTLDEHCDLSCSGLDSVGCRILTHEEVEKELDESLRPSIRERFTYLRYYLGSKIRGYIPKKRNY